MAEENEITFCVIEADEVEDNGLTQWHLFCKTCSQNRMQDIEVTLTDGAKAWRGTGTVQVPC